MAFATTSVPSMCKACTICAPRSLWARMMANSSSASLSAFSNTSSGTEFSDVMQRRSGLQQGEFVPGQAHGHSQVERQLHDPITVESGIGIACLERDSQRSGELDQSLM